MLENCLPSQASISSSNQHNPPSHALQIFETIESLAIVEEHFAEPPLVHMPIDITTQPKLIRARLNTLANVISLLMVATYTAEPGILHPSQTTPAPTLYLTFSQSQH